MNDQYENHHHPNLTELQSAILSCKAVTKLHDRIKKYRIRPDHFFYLHRDEALILLVDPTTAIIRSLDGLMAPDGKTPMTRQATNSPHTLFMRNRGRYFVHDDQEPWWEKLAKERLTI